MSARGAGDGDGSARGGQTRALEKRLCLSNRHMSDFFSIRERMLNNHKRKREKNAPHPTLIPPLPPNPIQEVQPARLAVEAHLRVLIQAELAQCPRRAVRALVGARNRAIGCGDLRRQREEAPRVLGVLVLRVLAGVEGWRCDGARDRRRVRCAAASLSDSCCALYCIARRARVGRDHGLPVRAVPRHTTVAVRPTVRPRGPRVVVAIGTQRGRGRHGR